MPTGWRITKAKHAATAFDGEGAWLYGSRWSNPGTRVAFAAESLSLAILEILAHLQKSSPLADFVVFTVELPEELVQDLDRSLLPKNWRTFPAPPQTREIGDLWIRRSSGVLLRAPSVIVPHEHNYLINPLHPDFQKLVLGGPTALDIDSRVLEGRK